MQDLLKGPPDSESKTQPQAAPLGALFAPLVGAVHTSFADADREAYGDLAPDVVLWPGAPDEIRDVLEQAQKHNARVAVTGAGTRARYHWPPPDGHPRVALDTKRLTNILRLDGTSMLVHCQSGIELRFLENALRRENLTLGPLPDSVFTSTLGGILADPPALAYAPSTGTLLDHCAGISVATPRSGLLETRVTPRRATGPDVTRLYLGSRGALGVITDAVLRVHRLPEHTISMLFAFHDLQAAMKTAATSLARGLRPARLRILASASAVREVAGDTFSGAIVLGAEFRGPEALVTMQRRQLEVSALSHGASELPKKLADRWAAKHQDPVSRSRPRAHAFIPFSIATETMLHLAEARVDDDPMLLVFDQFSAQGATLWIAHAIPTKDPTKDDGRDEEDQASFNALLSRLGLATRRRQQPNPTIDRLRQALDPTGVLLSPQWR